MDKFSNEQDLTSVPITHPTYYHFLGNGQSDSHLDKLLFSKNTFPEELISIICKLSNPLVDSHHDVILTRWSLPYFSHHLESSDNVKAPRIENNRVQISWSEEGIGIYQILLTPYLISLQSYSVC